MVHILLDEAADISEQLLGFIIPGEPDYEFRPSKYLEDHHPDGPEVPDQVGWRGTREVRQKARAIGHLDMLASQPELALPAHAEWVGEIELCAVLVQPDAAWLDRSQADLELDELLMGLKEQVDDLVAFPGHELPVADDAAEADSGASGLQQQVMPRGREALEVGDMLAFVKGCKLAQADGVGNLVRLLVQPSIEHGLPDARMLPQPLLHAWIGPWHRGKLCLGPGSSLHQELEL